MFKLMIECLTVSSIKLSNFSVEEFQSVVGDFFTILLEYRVKSLIAAI